MDEVEEEDHYLFKMPFASSIRPLKMEPEETLSIVYEINTAMAPSRRLPSEILDRITEEVHRPNTVCENIRSAWNAVPIYPDFGDGDRSSYWKIHEKDLEKLLSQVVLDLDRMKYHIVEDPPSSRVTTVGYTYLGCLISSADLLYRILCFFPEIVIQTGDGYKRIWRADICHKETGIVVSFSERMGGAMVYLGSTMIPHAGIEERRTEYRKKLQLFSEDYVKLLNALVGTVDVPYDDTQLAYFHPAAVASLSFNSQRYVAVPFMSHERMNAVENSFGFWFPVEVSFRDLSTSSSFRSILPILKYNVILRRVVLKGAPLTEVISSAVLFYRLICKFHTEDEEATFLSSNVGFDRTTSSVWQMKLKFDCEELHYHNAYILIMDDHGLFDIQTNEEGMEVMDFIAALIEALCSDNCTHPYDGTVAGCVA